MKEEIEKMVRENDKKKMRENFFTDPQFTFSFFLFLSKAGKDFFTNTVERKIRKNLPNFFPFLRKVIEVPPENIVSLIRYYFSHSHFQKLLPLYIISPSIFGGYWLTPGNPQNEEDVKKLFALMRKLITFSILQMKDRNPLGKQIFNFVTSFFVFLDEEKIVPSWRIFIDQLDKDQESRKILKEIFTNFFFLDKPVTINFPSKMPPLVERIKDDKDGSELFIFIPTNRNIVQQIYNEIINEIEESNQKIEEFIKKINFEKLVAEIPYLWKKILNPLYSLRPDGKDKVEINLPELTTPFSKYLLFEFYPIQWPEVKVKVIIEIFKERYSYFLPILSPTESEVKLSDVAEKINFILLFLALLSYKKIVTGEMIKTGKGEKKTETEKMGEMKKKIWIRAHFRNLPPHWKASKRAMENAKMILGQSLPPGKTFVLPYEKGSGEEDTQPLFSVSKNDLIY